MASDSTSSNTLLVKHLPCELSEDQKSSLLKYFGASAVRCMPEVGHFQHAAFATFPDSRAAGTSLRRLHQLQVLGSRLVVEFARERENFPKTSENFCPVSEIPDKNEDTKKNEADGRLEFEKRAEEVMCRLRKSSTEKWGLRLHVTGRRYHYPPPTVATLHNICAALASVPRFYTQTCHLMNKMNLPAPFTDTHFPAPSFPVEEEGSELESDEEQPKRTKSEKIQQKNILFQKAPPKKKLRLSEQPILLQRENPEPSNATFEVPSAIKKKLEFNLRAKLPTADVQAAEEEAAAPNGMQDGGFGRFVPIQRNDKDQEVGIAGEVDSSSREFISMEELKNGRLGEKEMRGLKEFGNYKAGERTSRLYVKNLAKSVEEKDLERIYRTFLRDMGALQQEMFDLRLMTEGRMKGQAFVTLHSDEVAEHALKETNGFLLKGKPIVVQFARSAKAKATAPKGAAKKIGRAERKL